MKQGHDRAPPVSFLAVSQGDRALGEGEMRLQQSGGYVSLAGTHVPP